MKAVLISADMFESFTVFGMEIGMYGLMAVIGLLSSGFLSCVLIKKRTEYYLDEHVFTVLFVSAGLFIGAHILFGITNTGKIIKLLQNLDKVTFLQALQLLGELFGGMVFYGGLIGCSIVLLMYTSKKRRKQRSIFFDAFAVSIPLFHFFGRIGCFLAGCCYGFESSFGFIINGNVHNPVINGVRRFPVQLAEALLLLILFLVLFNMYRKRTLEGKLFFIYLIAYGVIRFALEFLRGDEIRGFIFSLSTSQFISILLITFAAICLLVKRKSYEKMAI